MTGIPRVTWAECERQIHLSCKASDENQFFVGTESISVSVGQLIRRHSTAEMWDSVGVYAHEDQDGTLVVRVMVFNPDWEGPLQIACIQSRPRDAGCLTAVGCNLDHITIDEPNAEDDSEKLSCGGGIAMSLGLSQSKSAHKAWKENRPR